MKHDAAALTDPFTSLTNVPLSLSSVRDCWRPLAILPIPNFGSYTTLAKRRRPITLASFDLELIEREVSKRLLLSMNHSEDPVQLFHRSKGSTLDAAASLIHHT